MPEHSRPSYTRNILMVMSFISKSPTAKLIAHAYEGRVERFLKFKILSSDAVATLSEGSEAEAEEMCKKIFCYGWLSPDGTFIEVPFAQHEETVERITGHQDCDTACEQGWVKFTCGLPTIMKVNVCLKVNQIKPSSTVCKKIGSTPGLPLLPKQTKKTALSKKAQMTELNKNIKTCPLLDGSFYYFKNKFLWPKSFGYRTRQSAKRFSIVSFASIKSSNDLIPK
jgi:hypothetical protein